MNFRFQNYQNLPKPPNFPSNGAPEPTSRSSALQFGFGTPSPTETREEGATEPPVMAWLGNPRNRLTHTSIYIYINYVYTYTYTNHIYIYYINGTTMELKGIKMEAKYDVPSGNLA